MVHIYPGAIHIHTTYSDGTSDISQVVRAAKKAGLSWIIVTDHNNMDGFGHEGFHDGVAVIVGEEISPDTANHYLALDIKTVISHEQAPTDYVAEVKQQGGFGFIAHPDEQAVRKNNYPALRWEDWSIKDFGGLEIWNYMSDWVDEYDAKNPLKAFLFRNHILKGPTFETLDWWDKLNEESHKIIPAVGGVDVHAFNVKMGFLEFKIFPYDEVFRTITNLVHLEAPLSEDFVVAKKQILSAVKKGENVIINRIWNDTHQLPCFMVKNSQKTAFAGQEIAFDDQTKLILKLPKKACIRLIYDGQLVWECNKQELIFDKLDKGKYRVEVYFKDKPWIFSNCIKIY